jgi:hypothetical protein
MPAPPGQQTSSDGALDPPDSHEINVIPPKRSMTEGDFQYAIENTRVILAPQRQIASFRSRA